MAVVIETTLGDITVDLYLEQRPVTCLNFLKLCKMKYYNFSLFHSIRSGFIAQTGDPSGEGTSGQSIWGILEGPKKQYFSGEKLPKIRHTGAGLLSMVCTGDMMVGSQFFFTLASDLTSLDGVHCVIGEVTEGHDVLRKLNDVICDETHRPYQDVRITHTVVLEDPFNDPSGFRAPSRSPSPSAERLRGGRIAPDEDLDETQGKSAAEIQELIEEKEAKARATILEIVGDLPDADIAPPENVLFVCKLNPVTTDEDLEIIFSRFGKIVTCEVIRDKKTGDSLQYAFIEFADKKYCENAYLKMDNVLIDDRRIHVDFSQSVSKIKWLGKGRGVKHLNDDDLKKEFSSKNRNERSPSRDNSRNNYLRHEQNNERRKYNDREKYYEQERKSSRGDREKDSTRSERHINNEKNSKGNEKDSKQSRREKNYEREKRSEHCSTSDHREREVRKDKYSRSEKDIVSHGKSTDKSRNESLDRHSKSRGNVDKYAERNLQDSSNGRDGGYENQTEQKKRRNNEKYQDIIAVENSQSRSENARSRNVKESNTENKDNPNVRDRSFEKQDNYRYNDKLTQKRSRDSSNDSNTEKQSNKINREKQEERHAKSRYKESKTFANDNKSDRYSKNNYEDKRRSRSRSESEVNPNKKEKENHSKSSTSNENKEQRKSSKKENDSQPTNDGNGEVDGHKRNKRRNEKPVTHKSKKAKLSESSGEKRKSKAKNQNADKDKVSKVDKKRKRKRKQSTSTESESSTSSSSSESSSSEEDRKKRRTRKKRKRSSSSSSSESSSSSSSSSSSDSSSDSSSSSSESDSRKKKRKSNSKVVKKSKKQ